MAIKKPENLSFEEAIGELELVVAALEQGELPLDEALARFERGCAWPHRPRAAGTGAAAYSDPARRR